ncbi:hypothetical protein [Photobacterium kishitanii]|uniref:hypothetical protein n=1 Tax=Photobacterium kishitanii TaxID=318456 RepID=UPI0027394830|nr:hypothetical protein [Photobacterium kishitanii]
MIQLPVSLAINDAQFFNGSHEQPQIPAKCYVVKQIAKKLMVNDACDNIDYLLEEVSFVAARDVFLAKTNKVIMSTINKVMAFLIIINLKYSLPMSKSEGANSIGIVKLQGCLNFRV